jgi:DNA modification methylase
MGIEAMEERLLEQPDMFGGVTAADKRAGLARDWGIPPFSVLSARDGEWQSRKRQWLNLGIQSEVGRGEDEEFVAAPAGSPQPLARDYFERAAKRAAKLSPGGSPRPACDYSNGERGDGKGAVLKGLTFSGTGFMAETMDERGGGTSIFDPVLCELAYRWWCPPGGTVLDPFAGGSVRGITAAVLGLQYRGHELSGRQIEANREQAQLIVPDNLPTWVQGDSAKTIPEWDGKADMLFSCPPYGNLEVYSDHPDDISTYDTDAFFEAHANIINEACRKLKDDSFACWVIGEYRDKRGNYVNFVGETIEAFRMAGLHYYNEAILVTSVGSLPVRTGRQFAAGRKLGKTHQNILVFVKGCGKRATKRFAEG